MGSAAKSNVGYLIMSVIGLVVGITLTPTILTTLAPFLSGQGAFEGLARTVGQFIPVGFITMLLSVAFGMAIYTSMKSQSGMIHAGALIMSVVTLIIGISLIPTVSNAAGNTAAAATGPCPERITYSNGAITACTDFPAAAAENSTIYVGSYLVATIGSGGASNQAANRLAERTTELVKARQLGGYYSLVKTISSFITIGYMAALLTAAFGMAQVGTGGALGRAAAGAARGGYRRMRRYA